MRHRHRDGRRPERQGHLGLLDVRQHPVEIEARNNVMVAADTHVQPVIAIP